MTRSLSDAPPAGELVAVPTTDVDELTRRGQGPEVVHRLGEVTLIRDDRGTVRALPGEAAAWRALTDPAVTPFQELLAYLDLAAFATRRAGVLLRP
ncbi:hypothetical protein SGUI_0573 [Serinicoccus hydrothermalis]|uniref:Uncharacterized protein n=1 Tax=Serinicoccus hydrothermalis TaxID=1758689 RepID=A0A1B1N961_9MICO|nr:hypothetical protein [Serinicoccus hydrothermalis]ANS77969.1 hypothetical protein SGUI_0573 [Serinicoccus hydrothermalis]